MVDLFCTPLVELIDRMRLEYEKQGSIFDLTVKKWYFPPQDDHGPNLSVRFHGRIAGNPVGPASGPQSQMAQNLVLSWLAGSRIIELKTVQVNDQLKISRPCIDATNIGYNVEWSQELEVHDSLDQYVQGTMLIHMLRHAPDQFGYPFGDVDLCGTVGETIYDMSIGYDLAGICSDKVRVFMDGMIDATEAIERLRSQIPLRLSKLRDLEYPTELSRSVTLSTFHGCPADEIERICEFLLAEVDVDVIVKMNPPMLGKDRLEHLLYDVMGYREIQVNPTAYTNGLMFDETIELCRRLSTLAQSRGLRFGAKFSNTLEVINHREFFIPDEKIMYLSGPPLHVITLALTDQFRQTVGHEMPISFSAGVDRKNFAQLVACGLTPITTCTDLLKTGGYGRLPAYLQDLAKAMADVHASTIDDYVLDARGQRAASGGDAVAAGLLNTAIIAQEAREDTRYRHDRNTTVPRRINSHLTIFDCITCNKCIPVCPNDANFLYETPDVDLVYYDIQVSPDGAISTCGAQKSFIVQRTYQIANFADYCNHCGNCDTFCPEYDGPYLKKPSFFGSRQAFDEGAPYDGFFVEGNPGSFELWGRIDGQLVRLQEHPKQSGYRYQDGTVTILVQDAKPIMMDRTTPFPQSTHIVDVGRFHTMVILLRGITKPSRVHPVNTPLLARDRENDE